MRSRTSGAGWRRSMTMNAPIRTTAKAVKASVVERGPSLAAGLHDRVDEGDETAGHRRGAGQIEAAARILDPALRNEPQGSHHDGDADGHVDDEDPRP